jgi:Uma2 family endonuclease
MPIYRLSVPQYHAMVKAGILTENDEVELIRGWLVPKMSKNSPHRIANSLLVDVLPGLCGAGWHLQVQDPITLADSEPEPDGAVIRGRPRDYANRHPGPADVGLVIEVADTTLASDRTEKKQLYAEAKIPTYWIVNLVDGVIEMYTDPVGADYASRHDLRAGDDIPLVLDGRLVARVAVRDLLP